MIKQICGTEFERMFRSGLNNLRLHEQEINDMNVFPVPDGDTGTNMRLTLEGGLANAPSQRPSGAYLKGLSDGMLRSARGNSGVILSQLFKGLFQGLCHDGNVNAYELRDALVKAYKCAYAAVLKPAEGTLLTVSREGIEKIRRPIDRNTGVDVLLSLYLAECRRSLARTPKLLPALAEAGVVDSGAMGYVTIVEGMLKALSGNDVVYNAGDEAPAAAQDIAPDDSLFNAYTPFCDGYCLEFILQLMRIEGYHTTFRRDTFAGILQKLGNSIVCVYDASAKRVKVHIHTKTPEKVLAYARRYGEFVTFKLENMQLEHSRRDVRLEKGEKKKFARVAVVNSRGAAELFRGLGCEAVLDGGRTMNTSAQDFIEAFSKLNAERILVLPDSKNIAGAAKQAAELFRGAQVDVLETPDIAAGYYALCMDEPDSDDADRRVEQIKSGLAAITGFSVCQASRDSAYDGIPIEKGQAICFRNGKVCAAGENLAAVLRDAFRKAAADGCDFETLFVFCSDIKDAEGQGTITEIAGEFFPMADINFLDGGQPVYRYVIGAV